MGLRGPAPRPIAIQRQKGDTRKLGANKYAAAMDSAWEARRGRPDMPSALSLPKVPKPPRSAGLDADEPALQRFELLQQEYRAAVAARARIRTAREHWEYLSDQLDSEQLLAAMDGGTLLATCMAYALMVEAGRAGDHGAFSKHHKAYQQSGDRMGLSESARARLPRQNTKRIDEIEAALCG